MTPSKDFLFIISSTYGWKKGYIDPKKENKLKRQSKKDVKTEVIIA